MIAKRSIGLCRHGGKLQVSPRSESAFSSSAVDPVRINLTLILPVMVITAMR